MVQNNQVRDGVLESRADVSRCSIELDYLRPRAEPIYPRYFDPTPALDAAGDLWPDLGLTRIYIIEFCFTD